MKIVINSVLTSVITPASAEELVWLQATTRVAIDGGRTLNLYNKDTGIIGTGLVPRIMAAAAASGVPVEFVDLVAAALPAPPQLDSAEVVARFRLQWLRDYQLNALNTILQKRFGIIQIATGGGKTEIGVALTQCAPGRWLILAHRTNLVTQFCARYAKRTGKPVAEVRQGKLYVGDRMLRDDEECFVGLTYQTAYKNMGVLTRLFGSITGVLFDEAHVAPAATFSKVAMALCNAYYRVGMSATPMDSGDERSINAMIAIGPIRVQITAKYLIERGFLTAPTIVMMPCAYKPPRGDDWHSVFAEVIATNEPRQILLARAAQVVAKPALLFVGDIKNGQLADAADRCERLGMNAGKIAGATKARDRVIEDLRNGELDVVVTTEVLQEGVDIPELEGVVVGSGEKSIVATLQRLGRGTRLSASTGKDSFTLYDVLDYLDTASVEGDIFIPTHYSWMEKHARRRAKAYVDEGHRVVVGLPGEDINTMPSFDEWSRRMRAQRAAKGVVVSV